MNEHTHRTNRAITSPFAIPHQVPTRWRSITATRRVQVRRILCKTCTSLTDKCNAEHQLGLSCTHTHTRTHTHTYIHTHTHTHTYIHTYTQSFPHHDAHEWSIILMKWTKMLVLSHSFRHLYMYCRIDSYIKLSFHIIIVNIISLWIHYVQHLILSLTTYTLITYNKSHTHTHTHIIHTKPLSLLKSKANIQIFQLILIKEALIIRNTRGFQTLFDA